jgi:hypothetical protein
MQGSKPKGAGTALSGSGSESWAPAEDRTKPEWHSKGPGTEKTQLGCIGWAKGCNKT